MVKRFRFVLLLVTPLLASLTACQVFVELFSLSPFPGYLAQAVASVDLSTEIEKYLEDDEKLWESDVYVTKNGSDEEYVFLIVRKDPGGQCVYAFDTSLNLISKKPIDFPSYIHLFDANTTPPGPYFVAGDVGFSGSPLIPTINPYPDIGNNWDNYAFSHSGSNFTLRSNGSQIECDMFDFDWANSARTPSDIGSPTDMQLRGIGYDYDPSAVDPVLGENAVYLFLHSWDDSSDHGFLQIVRTAASSYPNVASTIDLYTDWPVSKRVYDVRGENRVFYTRKGVVAESKDRGTYYLLTLDGQIEKRFPVTRDHRPAMDFDIDGDYYYVFDEHNYRLYKANTGF